MDKFLLYFFLTERCLKIALAQKTGNAILPLPDFYSWPTKDAWEEIRVFLETQKWVSSAESVSLLNTITQVINYWDGQDPKVTKDISNIKKKFPTSLYSNLIFWGVKKNRKF